MSKPKACNGTLKSKRTDNHNELMFGHLNINSIKNKLELLVEQVKGNLDVLMEPKLMIVFLLVSSGQMVFVHFTY